MTKTLSLKDEIRRGQELFNSKEFFECHEYLELAWKRREGDEKILLQGLIQFAAGLYKLQKDKAAFEGALYLLDRGLEKVERGLHVLRVKTSTLAPLIEIRNRVVAESVDLDDLPELRLV